MPEQSSEPSQSLADLRARFAHAGRLEWIGLRPERWRIECVTRAELAPERGLLGDHRAAQVGGKRRGSEIVAFKGKAHVRV